MKKPTVDNSVKNQPVENYVINQPVDHSVKNQPTENSVKIPTCQQFYVNDQHVENSILKTNLFYKTKVNLQNLECEGRLRSIDHC